MENWERYLEEINSRIECLLDLGFDNDTIILMTCNNPYIFLYSNENITTKFSDFNSIGFSDIEINNIFKNFPILFGYDINMIKEKIKYFESINLHDIIINNSKCLFYSIDLIRARNLYLFNKKFDKNDLFLNDLEFEKKFKISRDKLLKGEF